MKNAIVMAALALSACDDSIPGLLLCNVDSDCRSSSSGTPGTCYEGICIDADDDGGDSGDGGQPSLDDASLGDAGQHDAGRGDAGGSDVGHACVATSCDDNNPCTVDSCSSTNRVCVQTPATDSRGCDDGNACTSGDHCGFGHCLGTPVACTASDACHGVGTCDALTGRCSNPVKDNGSTCGDGAICVSGSCSAGCWIDSVHYTGGATKSGNPCLVCDPGKATSAWSTVADGTGCGGTGEYCNAGICQGGCMIDSHFFASGTTRPGYPCQACQSVRPGAWSSLADRTSCSAGAVSCFCFSGLAWNLIESPTPYDLYAVSGNSASNVWAVGDKGTAMNFDGNQWSNRDTGLGGALRGVWVNNAGKAFSAGSQGNVLAWNGSWTPLRSDTATEYSAVWGNMYSDVYVVGSSTLVCDGICFEAQAPSHGLLHGVSGSNTPIDTSEDVWAVGSAGTILHYDGEWKSLSSSPTAVELDAVWGSGPNDVWVAGWSRQVFHSKNGSVWTTHQMPNPVSTESPDFRLTGGWGSASDTWVVGFVGNTSTNVGTGAMFHWDGVTWSAVTMGARNIPFAIWGNSQDIWVVGHAGYILRAKR